MGSTFLHFFGSVSGALTVCYFNNYEVTQSLVAELKKLEGARYQKEIGRVAPSQKLTKFN